MSQLTDILAAFVAWFTPATITAVHPTIGTVKFQTGWMGWSPKSATYYTPLGEVENAIDPETGAAILQHCRDWVDALVLVDHSQSGCDCGSGND